MLRAPVLPAAFRFDPLPGTPGSPDVPGAPDALRLLTAAMSDARFMAALELASPDLVHGVRSQLDGMGKGDVMRTALAVHRYARRAATRPTPFGLYAGVTAVAFAGNTKVGWSEPAGHRVVARADTAVLARLARVLELDGTVLRWLRVQAHQLVETHGDRVVMANATNPDIDPGSDGRAVTSVRATPVVLAVIEVAQRPVPVHELVAVVLARFARATEQAVLRLVCALVAEQVLVTELRPRLGPADQLMEMRATLHRIDRAASAHASTHAADPNARVGDSDVRDRLDVLARVVGALPDAAPQEVVHLLREVRADANAYTNSAVHVDLGFGHSVQLPADVAAEGARAAEALWRLAPPLLGTPALRGYHAEFVERYGLGRLVPIKELVDADRGLGAPAGYSWPPGPRGGDVETEDVPGVRPQGIARLLTSLLCKAVRDGRREVVLDDALLAALLEGEHDPDSAPPEGVVALSGPAAGYADAGARTARSAGGIGR